MLPISPPTRTHRHKTQDDDMVWPPDDFTGVWIVEWPNGQLKFRGFYLKGKAEGDCDCFWSNGNLAQEGQRQDGECVGTWVDYLLDGTKSKETEYFSPGNFDVRWFTPNGQVREVEIVRVGCKRETKKLIPDDSLERTN